MDIIAVLAPILAHLGLTTISQWIYFVYSFLCHQRPWRSIHLFDFQVAWCTRDLFIYLSMALSAFFVKAFKIRKVKWYVALLSIIPFALDGTIQMIAEINGVLNDKEVFFKKARPIEIKGECLVLNVPYRFHKQRIESRRAQEAFKKISKELFGKEVLCVCEVTEQVEEVFDANLSTNNPALEVLGDIME
ncbi:DUF2085 domain-containing protein [Patescibacteria group bacterium]